MIEPAGVEIFEHKPKPKKNWTIEVGSENGSAKKKKHVGPAEPGGNYSLNRA